MTMPARRIFCLLHHKRSRECFFVRDRVGKYLKLPQSKILEVHFIHQIENHSWSPDYYLYDNDTAIQSILLLMVQRMCTRWPFYLMPGRMWKPWFILELKLIFTILTKGVEVLISYIHVASRYITVTYIHYLYLIFLILNQRYIER